MAFFEYAHLTRRIDFLALLKAYLPPELRRLRAMAGSSEQYRHLLNYLPSPTPYTAERQRARSDAGMSPGPSPSPGGNLPGAATSPQLDALEAQASTSSTAQRSPLAVSNRCRRSTPSRRSLFADK